MLFVKMRRELSKIHVAEMLFINMRFNSGCHDVMSIEH